MINRDEIVAVYSGRPGCACGCRGNHSTSKASITRIVNKINAIAPDAKKIGNHYFAETETRLYIAYWTTELIFPPKVGDAVVVMMKYGEENVTITSVDVDAQGFDVVDAAGCTFWISADDVLRAADEVAS